MAYVHRAELVGAEGFRKTVALKRMRTATSENPDFVTSFITEGRLAARLRHPNIAQAYELGKIGGTYFIAMEYVPGPTLAQVMARSRRAAGAIPLPIVLEILIQLCDALDHAHELRDEGGRPLNLVHRDISPMNIIVSRAGTAKLIDFGIAKLRGSSVVTQAGVIKGKHAYVAPEYVLGTGLDRRVDLWGLGVVAHEMITGRRLFLGDTEAETIRNVRTLAIPPPSRIATGISAELDDIVMTALSRDPAKRWQNAAAMRAALTEEARRQRAVISGAQIRDWIEWAFRQPTREDSPIGHLLDDLEPSISIQIEDLEPVSSVEHRPDPADEPVRVVEPIAVVDASGEIDDVPTVDANVKPKRPASIVIDPDLRQTPRFATNVPSLGFSRARVATGTVPPVEPPRLTPRGGLPFVAPVPDPLALEDTGPALRPPPAPLPRRPAATPRQTPILTVAAPRAATPIPEAVPHHISPLPTSRVRPLRTPRRPHHGNVRWRPPTRWTREPRRSQFPQFVVLLMLAAFAAMCVELDWIDIEGWRQLLGF